MQHLLHARTDVFWPFKPSHKGVTHVVLCHNLCIFWGFLCWKEINFPSNPISYLAHTLKSDDKQRTDWVGEAQEREAQHLWDSQPSVTSFLMISMADGRRDTQCALCILALCVCGWLLKLSAGFNPSRAAQQESALTILHYSVFGCVHN